MSVELSGVRSSWLMLARNSLLYWLERSSSAAFSPSTSCALREVVFLVLEQLRLFLELRVGLFELRLLGFQPHLRFLERARLHFQLFVADAQLFLLGLQLFGLALGLGEQVFQARAILRGAHGDAERFGDALQQLTICGLRSARSRPISTTACTIPSVAAGATMSSRGFAADRDSSSPAR